MTFHQARNSALIKRISLTVVVFILSFLSSFAYANYSEADLPSTGYKLVVDNDGGHIFVDGVEISSDSVVEVEPGTSVSFLAEPEDGYVVKEWETYKSNGNLVGTIEGVNLYNCYFDRGRFYEIHVSFEQKDCYKLYYSCVCEGLDVTLRESYKEIAGEYWGTDVCSLYTVSSDISIEQLFDDFYTYAQPTYIVPSFSEGLNYYTFDLNSNLFLIIEQNLFPALNFSTNTPFLLGDGFAVSDESMVVCRKTIRSMSGDFSGKNYIVLELSGDISVVSNIHNISFTSLNVKCDSEKGDVVVTPEKRLSPNYWYEGTAVTLQAKPKEGYRFLRWENEDGTAINALNETNNPFIFVLGHEAVSISAVFVPSVSYQRPIAVVSDPEGKAVIKVNGSEDIDSVQEGSTVCLNAIVDEFFVFDHWEVYSNDDTAHINLMTHAKQTLQDADFEMPYGETGVTIKAILLPRYSDLKTWVGIRDNISSDFSAFADIKLCINGVEIDGNYAKIQRGDHITASATVLNDDYSFVLLSVRRINGNSFTVVKNSDIPFIEFIVNDWTDEYEVVCLLEPRIQPDEPPQNKPTLSDGSAERNGETTATIYFTTDMPGTYYYTIVPSGSSATVDTSLGGILAYKGVNSFNLNTLTAEARDIYIVVRSNEGVVSEPLKINIPAYGDIEDEYQIAISISDGGYILLSKVNAKAGETVVINVLPDCGYEMVPGSLCYVLSGQFDEVVLISGNSFTMPASDITIICSWKKIDNEQTDASAHYWNDIISIYNSDPWWKYAEERWTQGEYPVYW